MRNKLLSVAMMTMVAGVAVAMGQAPDANKVMADVRAALGGADQVAAVKTLTAKGTIQRVTAQGSVERETELALELPDKYMARTVVSGEGSITIYRHAGFNGDGLINEIDSPPNLNQAMRARVAGASDRAPGAAGGNEPTAEERAALLLRQVLAAKKDFARLMLGMLGSSFEAFPLQLAYAGQADSADGQAHVIEAKGADAFDARLFVDVKTSLPLMVTWSDPGAGANAGRMIERRIFFSNFKKAGSLTVPHTMQRSMDGRTTEETTFAEITINPKIDGKKFAIVR